MSRLIDVYEYIKNSEAMNAQHRFGSVEHRMLIAFAEELLTAPTVDAVEVVRCKDCKNMIVSDKGFRFCNVWCKINGMGDNGYCNYGERKEEVNEP